jgi:hypothetical protein
MTLLRAAELMTAPPAPRHALSTLAALSLSPPPAPRDAAAPAPPRFVFPLIEALDLPGGLPQRRDGAPPRPSLVPAPPPPPAILAAAEIDLPLAELLRLVGAGTALPPDAFSAMRRSPRADRPAT